jgi:hypothetical protein
MVAESYREQQEAREPIRQLLVDADEELHQWLRAVWGVAHRDVCPRCLLGVPCDANGK